MASYEPPGAKPMCSLMEYPISVLFIIAQEFCERFSYYGMRTILSLPDWPPSTRADRPAVLYFTHFYGWTDSRAIVMYHVYVMVRRIAAPCCPSHVAGLLHDARAGRGAGRRALWQVPHDPVPVHRVLHWHRHCVCAHAAAPERTCDRAVTSAQPIAEATSPVWWGGVLGLMLIALGTGGLSGTRRARRSRRQASSPAWPPLAATS